MSGWVIYGLASPRAMVIRYVGFSRHPLARFKRHLQSARRPVPRYPVHRWIGAFLSLGLQPIMVQLDRGTGDGWQLAERAWIQRLACFDLLNVTPGGEGWNVSKESRDRAREKLKQRVFTPEHRARISAAKRGVPRTDADAVRERLRIVSQNNKGKKMNLSPSERARRSASAKALREHQLQGLACK